MTDRTSLIERVLDWLQSPVGLTLIAGLAGGVLRWITLRENPVQGLATMTAGGITAAFLGPLVASLFGLTPDENLQAFIGVSFLVGIGGISIGALILSLYKDRDIFTALKDAVIFLLTRGAGGPRT